MMLHKPSCPLQNGSTAKLTPTIANPNTINFFSPNFFTNGPIQPPWTIAPIKPQKAINQYAMVFVVLMDASFSFRTNRPVVAAVTADSSSRRPSTSPSWTSAPLAADQFTPSLVSEIAGSRKANFPGSSWVPANNTAKVDSKQVKQNVAKKKTQTNVPSCGRFSTPIICPNRGEGGAGSDSGFRLSPKMKNARIRLKPQIPAATHPGPVTPNQPALKAPRTGPKINPNPKAIPMSPIRFERSSGGEISAM